VGKTRLALQIAAEMRPHFPDGIAFIPLAPLADAGLVLPTVAQVLGVRERGDRPLGELLRHALRARRRLLVLATSREPIRIQGEHEHAVVPLALPDFEHSPQWKRRPAPRRCNSSWTERARCAGSSS
jgi:predicted ATPase